MRSFFVLMLGLLYETSGRHHHWQDNHNQTQYTCRNALLWQLHSNTAVLDIFEMKNVVVYPSDLYSEVVFGVRHQSPSMLQEMENALLSCVGRYSTREPTTAVFFNCPCREDVGPPKPWTEEQLDHYCPAHAKWKSELRLSHRSTTLDVDSILFDNSTTVSVITNTSEHVSDLLHPIIRRKKDLLIVFNSWGTTSLYHVMFDVIFPLWSTMHRVVTIGGHPSSSITLLNTAPSCPSDPREIPLHSLQPLVEILFGPNSYEITNGNISQSFGDAGNGTLYQHAVFGFAYPWRPHFILNKGGEIRFDPHIGQLFVSFAHDLRQKLYEKAISSGIDEGTAKALRLNLCDHRTDSISTKQGTIIKRVKDDGRRINTDTLLTYVQQTLTQKKLPMNLSTIEFGVAPLETYHEQAVVASSMSLLIGAEGAGFTQQLFLQPRSLLVIIHCPRPKSSATGYINGKKSFSKARVWPWHDAVAQYLGHSVLNILPPICAELTAFHHQRIADYILEVMALHQNYAIPNNQTINATVNVANSWTTRLVPFFLPQLKNELNLNSLKYLFNYPIKTILRGGDSEIDVEYVVLVKAPSKSLEKTAQEFMAGQWIVKVEVLSKWPDGEGCYVCYDEKKGQVVPLSLILVPHDDDMRSPNTLLPSEKRTSLTVSNAGNLPITNVGLRAIGLRCDAVPDSHCTLIRSGQ